MIYKVFGCDVKPCSIYLSIGADSKSKGRMLRSLFLVSVESENVATSVEIKAILTSMQIRSHKCDISVHRCMPLNLTETCNWVTR